MSSRKTITADIERTLSREILRGERAPGSTLPPVRALAEQFGVTAPTIQRVIERLATLGLVTAKRGSGVTVNDPEGGDISLFPLWFDALSDQPDRVVAILADFLELRRVVAVHLIEHKRIRVMEASLGFAELAVKMAKTEVALEAMEAEVALTTAVLRQSKHFAVSAIHRTSEQLLRDVPHVTEALYGDRAFHREIIGLLAQAFASEEPAKNIGEALRKWDEHTVGRYRVLVEKHAAKGAD